MIYVCEAIAFQHSTAVQNVNGACCTNRLKREPWHGKIGWLHKRFHFLVMFWWKGGGGKPKMSYDVLCHENRYMSAVKINIQVAPYRNPAFTHKDEDGNWSLLKHKMWVKPAFLKYSHSILRSVNVVYYDFSKQRWIIRRSSLLLVPSVIALFKHYLLTVPQSVCERR